MGRCCEHIRSALVSTSITKCLAFTAVSYSILVSSVVAFTYCTSPNHSVGIMKSFMQVCELHKLAYLLLVLRIVSHSIILPFLSLARKSVRLCSPTLGSKVKHESRSCSKQL